MDERNERLVFDRIVRSCCGDEARPQYYLVSPKLLQGLKSMTHDDVTVLIVCNGPGARLNWSLPAFTSSLKRQMGVSSSSSQGSTLEDSAAAEQEEEVVEAPVLQKKKKFRC